MAGIEEVKIKNKTNDGQPELTEEQAAEANELMLQAYAEYLEGLKDSDRRKVREVRDAWNRENETLKNILSTSAGGEDFIDTHRAQIRAVQDVARQLRSVLRENENELMELEVLIRETDIPDGKIRRQSRLLLRVHRQRSCLICEWRGEGQIYLALEVGSYRYSRESRRALILSRLLPADQELHSWYFGVVY